MEKRTKSDFARKEILDDGSVLWRFRNFIVTNEDGDWDVDWDFIEYTKQEREALELKQTA